MKDVYTLKNGMTMEQMFRLRLMNGFNFALITADAILELCNHFRGEYIPRMYHRLLGKLYNMRTIVERKNSNEVIGYHHSKMPKRGIE